MFSDYECVVNTLWVDANFYQSFISIWMQFITVATSLLVWSMGRSVTVATTSPACVWEMRSVTWTVKGRKAPPVEVLGACQCSRWRMCFQARGDVSIRDLVQSESWGTAGDWVKLMKHRIHCQENTHLLHTHKDTSRALLTGNIQVCYRSVLTCSCANYLFCVCRQERALPRLLQGAWQQLLYISGPCAPAQPYLPVLHRGLH